jgi:hypothetical protein
MNTGKGKVLLKSSEYLRHLNVHLAEKDTTISTWNRELLLKEFTYDRTPWINEDRTITTFSDLGTTYDLLVKLHFKYRPQKFTLSFSTEKNKIEDVSGLFITGTTDHSVSMRWESFPDTSLLIPIHFRVAKTDSVTETIEAKFIEMIEPVRIEKEFTNIISRTTLRKTEIIKH